MPSFMTLALAALLTTAGALPAMPRLSARQFAYHQLVRRQNAAAQAAGLDDFAILQFALTLENLENTFYSEGFQKFPDSDFSALGLTDQQISDLKQIGATEGQHVGLIQSSLAQNGIQPVVPCTYDFGLTDAASMVATAGVLETVGIAAYMGAAPLVADPGILGIAASILTVEARHSSSLRVFGGQEAVPQAFDVPLGPRAIFSLAAPFIKECPQGSDLTIEAFPSLAMADGQTASTIGINQSIKLTADGSAGATHCGFTSGGVNSGGTKFAPFTEADGCVIPEGVAGVSFVTLTNAGPLDGLLTDEITVAGPMAITVS